MFVWNGHKINMLPSIETGSDKKITQLTTKQGFNVGRSEEEFMSQMKEIERLYVMVVRSLGMEKIK